MNHAMRCDLRRLGHWALEGLGLWQGFGLGGITSPFTVLSSLGSPSVMATTANGRESRLLVWGDSSRTPYFGRDIKAKKCTSVSQVAEAVYSTNLKKKKSHMHAQPLAVSLRSLCKPRDPILRLLLWIIL